MKVLRLLFRYLFDFATANLAVAKLVLSPRMEISPEVVEMETEVESTGEVLVLANLISFTPGSLTLVIEPENRRLVVHVLNDGESTAQAIQEKLENPLLDITRKNR